LYIIQDGQTIEQERLDVLKQNLEPIFVFAIVWGTGGACDAASKAKMNEWMRSKKNMPAKLTVFDYAYDVLECKWRGWMETVEVMKHPKP
jgi:dynein heavy chain